MSTDRRAEAQLAYRMLHARFADADTATWDREHRIWSARFPEFVPDENGCCAGIRLVDE